MPFRHAGYLRPTRPLQRDLTTFNHRTAFDKAETLLKTKQIFAPNNAAP